MEESKLQKNARGVVLSIQALQTNKSALRKIRKRLAGAYEKNKKHFYDEPAKIRKTQDPNEGYSTVKGFKEKTNTPGEMPINIMIDDSRSVHNGHTMEYIPGTAQANPEYFNY